MDNQIPKLKRARRLDCIRLDAKDSTYFTEEGYLVDHPILTSCGIFEYKNEDGSVRRELRLPEHVFSADSLKSYRGKPIIVTHDAGVVDKDNVEREQIGTILTDGYQDGDNVRAEIIIHNTDKMMDSGLRELSLGYDLDLVEEPGVWEGQPYDAVQTNIAINHLALVFKARAGEKARLNIDGSDEPELKGGKANMKDKTTDNNAELTPEQLQEAVALWKAKKNAEAEVPAQVTDGASDTDPEAGAASDGGDVQDKDNADGESKPSGSSIEDKIASVKERRDKRGSGEEPADMKAAQSVIGQQDEDLDVLMACLEKLLSEKADPKPPETPVADKKDDASGAANKDDCDGAKTDSSEDQSKSMNADAADDIIRQRLSICRIGDKLHLDGLEDKSIMEGKKAIIAKVLPSIRLDGRSKAYVDACYDLAVGEVNKRKDVSYQRQQMTTNPSPKRTDGAENVSMAAAARQRMLDREGGNE